MPILLRESDWSGRGVPGLLLALSGQPSVSYSCSFMHKNQNYVVGGFNSLLSDLPQRQLLLVDDCFVSRLGNINFDFHNGACTVRNDEIYLCFGTSNKVESSKCRAAADPRAFIGILANYREINSSRYGHYETRIASSNGRFNFRLRCIFSDQQ